jgi:hypothetical protein
MPLLCLLNRRTALALAAWAALAGCQAGSVFGAQDEKPKGAAATGAELEIFTLSQLLGKAAHIVVAEVGETRDGLVELIVQKALQAPAPDKKERDADAIKRANALLKGEPPSAVDAKRIRVAPGSGKLPPPGSQAVFFLWDRIEGQQTADTACYTLSHPQCVYDLEALPQVQAGIQRPRAVADGRYLRAWDRDMAGHVRQLKLDQSLLGLKGGDVVLGLRIKAGLATFTMSKDNSFRVNGIIENTRAQEQMLYDGPAGGYGARLKPRGGGKGHVLRVSMRSVVSVDRAVLDIPEPADFVSIAGNKHVGKEMIFETKDFPILKTLSGEYLLSVFYTSSQDGAAELDEKAWTGTLVSEDIPIQFDAAAKP